MLVLGLPQLNGVQIPYLDSNQSVVSPPSAFPVLILLSLLSCCTWFLTATGWLCWGCYCFLPERGLPDLKKCHFSFVDHLSECYMKERLKTCFWQTGKRSATGLAADLSPHSNAAFALMGVNFSLWSKASRGFLPSATLYPHVNTVKSELLHSREVQERPSSVDWAVGVCLQPSSGVKTQSQACSLVTEVYYYLSDTWKVSAGLLQTQCHNHVSILYH